MQILFLACLVLTGLSAGVFWGSQLAQVPMQKTASAAQYIYLKHKFEVYLGPAMGPLMVISTLLQVPLLLVLRERGAAFWLIAASLLLWSITDVVVVFVNLPVNRQAARWNPDEPPVANWAQLRDRWHLGQTVRAYLIVSAFVLMQLAAVLLMRP